MIRAERREVVGTYEVIVSVEAETVGEVVVAMRALVNIDHDEAPEPEPITI